MQSRAGETSPYLEKNMEYPVLVFKDGGPYQRAGGYYNHMAVEDEAEYEIALLDGWFATLPEAIEGKKQDLEAEDLSAPTREELEQKATELGIKFDGRTNDKKLADKIEEALKG